MGLVLSIDRTDALLVLFFHVICFKIEKNTNCCQFYFLSDRLFFLFFVKGAGSDYKFTSRIICASESTDSDPWIMYLCID